MPKIETERWIPSPDDPEKLVYDGQRTQYEVYAALRQYLSDLGYLPDEYFLMDAGDDNHSPFPRDGYLSNSVDFGGSEGIYLDIALHWEDEHRKSHTRHFITGKTLGEGAEDMNRMHLAAAAVACAFSDSALHQRYVRVGGAPDESGLTIHLSDDEREYLAKSLLYTRKDLKLTGGEYVQAERLLRRLVGSITEYMQLVGERPLQIDDADTAELAVRESNMERFLDSYRKVPEKNGDLLVLAAGQPGRVGDAMIRCLLADPNDTLKFRYYDACKSAVRTGDTTRVLHLLDKNDEFAPDTAPRLRGEVIRYAYSLIGEDYYGAAMAKAIVRKSEPEQLRIDPTLVIQALDRRDFDFADLLLSKGADVTERAGAVLYAAAKTGYGWCVRGVLEQGVDIDTQDQRALHMAMQDGNIKAARLLADNGADCERFLASEAVQRAGDHHIFREELREYVEQQLQRPVQEQSM